MTDYDKLTRGELISLIRELKAAQTGDSGPVAATSADFPVFGEREQHEFENSPWPIRIFDRETLKYLAVNNAAVKLYGYTREEFLALTPLDTGHPEGHADFYDTLTEHTGYLRHKGPRRQLKKSGEIIVVELVMQDILFNGRNARLSLTMDVTERIRMQELLRQREQDFESLAENLPDIVVRFDREIRHVYVNAALERATGLPREAFLGKTHHEISLPPHLAERFDRSMREVFETGCANEIEFSLVTREGERFFMARHIPERDAEGVVRTALCVAHDVTDLKQAMERIREREHEFSALVEHAPDIIARFDRDLRYVYVNPAGVTATGFAAEALIGKTARELGVPLKLALSWEKDLWQVFRRGKEQRVDFACPTRHGVRHFEARVVPELGVNGSVVTVLSIARDITERKKAEGEVKRQKKLLDAVIDNLPVGVFTKDAKSSRLLMFNRSSKIMTNYPGERAIGKTPHELFPKEQADSFVKSDREALDSGRMVEIPEQKVVGRSGDLRIQHVRKVPIFGDDGEPWLLVGISDDITDRKKAEDELKRQKKLLDTVIDNLPVGVFIKDAKTFRFVIRNRFAERAFGYPLKDPIGKTVYDLFPKEQADSLWESDREAVAKGRMVEISEHEVIGRSGDIRIGHIRKVPIFDDDGEPWLLVGIVDDITDRKRAEEALRESEKRFRALAENIRDVFWINTAYGDQVLYVSPAYEEIWGRDRDSLYRNPYGWLEAVHPADVPAVKAGLAAMAVGEQVCMEYRIVRPDGTVRWIRDRSYPMKSGDGTQLACGVAEDITGYKRAEAERLAAVRQQRDALVREVHHRIKNNLQGVVGLLRQLATDQARVRPLIDKAVAQLQAIAVVHGLQAHGPESGIGLRDMMFAICSVAQGMLNVEIRLDFGLDGDAIVQLKETEAVPVALVLNELMTNAARRGKNQGGSDGVWVTVRGEMESVRVTISNPGRLPRRFDFAAGRGIGTGLELLKSLLPQQGVRVTLSQAGKRVNADVEISPPVLMKQRSSALVFQE